MSETSFNHDWRKDAACKDQDPELFFPTPTNSIQIEEAKAVCRGCKAIEACLAWALENNAAGVWGETTDDERRALKQSQSKPGAMQ